MNADVYYSADMGQRNLAYAFLFYFQNFCPSLEEQNAILGLIEMIQKRQ